MVSQGSERNQAILMKTQGEAEGQISSEFCMFYSQMFGKGPKAIRVVSVNSIIVIIAQNLLTNSEKLLVTSESGRRMIRDVRKGLIDSGRIELTKIVSEATGEEIHNVHHDFIVDGEESFVFSLEKAPVFRTNTNGQGKLVHR